MIKQNDDDNNDSDEKERTNISKINIYLRSKAFKHQRFYNIVH